MRPATRAVAAAFATVCVLTGCSRVIDGNVAMTVEPLSSDITCGEYIALSDMERIKAVSQILADEPKKGNMGSRPAVVGALASLMCQQLPQLPLKDFVGSLGLN